VSPVRGTADRIASVILLLIVLAVWLPRVRGPIDLRWDGAVYYILGTSLAEGKGYRLLNEPGEIQALQYPPLLPVIVALHQWVLGTSDPIVVGRWLRLFFFLVFAAYIQASYGLLRAYLPVRYAFVGTVVCVLNLHTYFMSDLCFPDIIFALLTIAFLLCHRQGDGGPRSYRIQAGLCAVAAFAVRTAGIALLAAWVTESVLNRRPRQFAVRLALVLIPTLSWLSYTRLVELTPEYRQPSYAYQRADYVFHNVSYARNLTLRDSFRPELGYASIADIGGRVLSNVTRIPTSLAEGVSSKKRVWEVEWNEIATRLGLGQRSPWLIDAVLPLLGSLILVGLCLLAAQRHWMIPLVTVASLALMCLTPWPEQFTRYLVPLGPLLVLSLLVVLRTLDRHSRTILGGNGALGLAMVVATVGLILAQETLTLFVTYTKWHQRVTYDRQDGTKVAAYRLFFYHDPFRALDAGLDWLRPRATPTDVVALSMPHWAYLRTGLRSVMPPLESDPVKAEHLIESVPVKYLILDEGLAVDTKQYLVSVIQMFPDRWTRVYSDKVVTELGETHDRGFEIYEHVTPQPPAVSTGK